MPKQIAKDALCEILVRDKPELQKNLNILRKGYPESPWNMQTKGKKFRKAAENILKTLAKRTLKIIDNRDKKRIVILMPWRSGLAFGKSYSDAGIKRFYHLSSKRDEKTLLTIVDYEFGTMGKTDIVIIADPMLATGNTVLDAIGRIRRRSVSPKNIIINSVVAAPAGIAQINKKYPEIKIITGVLDRKLDRHGFIVPGLGDFGDKFFTELSKDELKKFIASFKLPPMVKQKLRVRMKNQKISADLKIPTQLGIGI